MLKIQKDMMPILPNNFILFGRMFRLIAKKIFLLLMTTLFTLTIYSQKSRTSPTQTDLSQSQRIMHVDQFIESLKANRSNDSNLLKVESLIKDLQPSIYVSSIDVKIYGENPICLFIDAKSLNKPIPNLLNNDIEIVTIKINDTKDLNSIINLSLFSSFPKLKYIYILSTVKSKKDDIIRLVKNNNPKYSVFYNILKTS